MHLNFLCSDGYIFYAGNLIAVILLLPALIWFCIQVNKHAFTPVLHCLVFGIVTLITYWLGSQTGIFPDYWWIVTPALMLVGLGREIYSKIRYNDFGWDDLLYDFIGTFCITVIYWAIYVVK